MGAERHKRPDDMLGRALPPIDHEKLVDRIECLLEVSNRLRRIGVGFSEEEEKEADGHELATWIVDQWLRPSPPP